MSNTNFNNSFPFFSDNDPLGNLPSLNNFNPSLLLIPSQNSVFAKNQIEDIENQREQNEIDQQDSLGLQLKTQNKYQQEHVIPNELSKSSSRKRKTGCICKKTKCLKMYCQCFSSNNHCVEGCKCQDCLNLPQFQQQIDEAHCIIKTKGKIRRKCTCKKSHCQKKYCECYNSGISCGSDCKCIDCHNLDKQQKFKQQEGKNNTLAKIHSMNQINELLF